MINLNIIKNQKLSKHRVVEILFFAFPLSFIIGNLVLSLHLLLFLIFSDDFYFKSNNKYKLGQVQDEAINGFATTVDKLDMLSLQTGIFKNFNYFKASNKIKSFI